MSKFEIIYFKMKYIELQILKFDFLCIYLHILYVITKILLELSKFFKKLKKK